MGNMKVRVSCEDCGVNFYLVFFSLGERGLELGTSSSIRKRSATRLRASWFLWCKIFVNDVNSCQFFMVIVSQLNDGLILFVNDVNLR